MDTPCVLWSICEEITPGVVRPPGLKKSLILLPLGLLDADVEERQLSSILKEELAAWDIRDQVASVVV